MTQKNLLKKEAFTLIELAIVLVVIGLLVSLGTSLIGPLTKRTKYIETKEIVNAAVDSIISYASANNYIPTTGTFTSAVRNPNDAWTKPLLYIPDVNLDDLNVGGVCGRKTTGITVRFYTDAVTYTDISNVAFVIVSGSENYNIQTNNVSGTVTVYETGAINIDDYTTDMNRPEPYDDIVKWVTLDELRTKAGCRGAQLNIISNELPFGFINSPYGTISVFADGGVGSSTYQWSRQQSASTGLTFNPNTLYTTYGTATTLTISGTPTVSGSYNFTFFVKDGDDNNAQKSLILTINPKTQSACTGFTVFNRTNANKYYKMLPAGACTGIIATGANITSTTGLLNAGESLSQYTTAAFCATNTTQAQITFAQAASLDEDGDCTVAFSALNTAVDD